MTDTLYPADTVLAANVAQTMRDVMADIGTHDDVATPEGLDLTKPHLVAVPTHRKIVDLSEFHQKHQEFLKPARRRGCAKLSDLNSLIAWANRFKGDTSVLYANPDMSAPTLTCIADYHASGSVDPSNAQGEPTARHCAHSAIYSFPLSEEWKIWTEISGIGLEKDALGELIEAQAKDIMDPTPAILNGQTSDENAPWENRLIETAQRIEGHYGQLHQLLQMSKRFQIFETSDLAVSTNRDTGEAEVLFKSEHQDAKGEKLNIPNLIIITIPVFRGGAPYRMPVRFRYRKNGGTLKFVLTLYNPEKSFEAAFEEAVQQATQDTELETFLGKPEA